MVDHIRTRYDTDYVDLVISTHPDQDHINGLGSVLDAFTVGEILIHNPHGHADDVTDFSNIEVVDALIGLAEEKGVPVTEPFTGLERFGGQVRVLGPTLEYYEALLTEHLAEALSTVSESKSAAGRSVALSNELDLLKRLLTDIPPVETLGEDGETGPRNNSSVVTLLTTDADDRLLFTGDAGIPAMDAAYDEYERVVGGYPDYPLDFFQAPHHGSRRNLSPSVLNRIFGKPGENPLAPVSFISSAKSDPKHPSPKVTNALKRRGVSVFATEGKSLWQRSPDAPSRDDYSSAAEVPALEEDDD